MARKNSSYRSKPSSRSHTKAIVILCLLVLLAIAIGGALTYKHRHDQAKVAAAAAAASVNPTNTIDYNPAPAADNAQNEARKSSSASSTLDSGSLSVPASFTVQLNVPQVNGNNVHIGDLVNGTTSGSCSLTASKSGQTTLQLASSSVAQDVNTYDCGVFNVSTSAFPGGGTWKLTLTVTNNGSSASDITNVTI